MPPVTQFSTSKDLYLRLLGYVRPYWPIFAAAMICMGLSSIVEPVLPAIMKNLLDNGFSTQSPENWDWLFYPIVIITLFVFRAILGFIGDYAMSWVSNKVVVELREAMFDKIVHLPTTYLNDNTSGRLMSRVTYDVGNVTGAATTALTSLVKDTLSVVGLLGWLFYLNWRLTLITLVMVPFSVLLRRSCRRRRSLKTIGL